MKKINLYILLFGISFIFILCSCEKEDDLKISEKKTQRFDLPQGNHDFDEQIVEWYNDYETAVLYKFSNADINYHFTSSSNDVNYDVKVEADEEGIRHFDVLFPEKHQRVLGCPVFHMESIR